MNTKPKWSVLIWDSRSWVKMFRYLAEVELFISKESPTSIIPHNWEEA